MEELAVNRSRVTPWAAVRHVVVTNGTAEPGLLHSRRTLERRGPDRRRSYGRNGRPERRCGVERRWGKRRLAYEIKGQLEGIYALFKFEGNNEILDELKRVFKFDSVIVRHMILLDESPSDEQPVAHDYPVTDEQPDADEEPDADEQPDVEDSEITER